MGNPSNTAEWVAAVPACLAVILTAVSLSYLYVQHGNAVKERLQRQRHALSEAASS